MCEMPTVTGLAASRKLRPQYFRKILSSISFRSSWALVYKKTSAVKGDQLKLNAMWEGYGNREADQQDRLYCSGM